MVRPLAGSPPLASHEVGGNPAIRGFAVSIPLDAREALVRDVSGLGVVDARALTSHDWVSMFGWASVRPLQQRRLLGFVMPV